MGETKYTIVNGELKKMDEETKTETKTESSELDLQQKYGREADFVIRNGVLIKKGQYDVDDKTKSTASKEDKSLILSTFRERKAAREAKEIALKNEKKPVVMTAAEKKAAEAMIMEQLVGFCGKPQPTYDKPVNYVQAANGNFLVKKTAFGQIITKTDKIPYIPEISAGLNYTLPKVPYDIFLQAFSFFKDVTDKRGDEAALVLYWVKDKKEYELFCPKQEVSGATVNFAKDPIYVARLTDSNFTRVCELHSHNSMGAFHSGTDNNDEVFDCTFIVFGKLKDANPEFIFSYASSGKRVDSELWDIFEKPVSEIKVGDRVVANMPIDKPFFAMVPFPAEWNDQLSKETYVSYGYYGKDSKNYNYYDDEDYYAGYGAYYGKDKTKDKNVYGKFGAYGIQTKLDGELDVDEVTSFLMTNLSTKQLDDLVSDFYKMGYGEEITGEKAGGDKVGKN